jgi:hypothetical protein
LITLLQSLPEREGDNKQPSAIFEFSILKLFRISDLDIRISFLRYLREFKRGVEPFLDK